MVFYCLVFLFSIEICEVQAYNETIGIAQNGDQKV